MFFRAEEFIVFSRQFFDNGYCDKTGRLTNNRFLLLSNLLFYCYKVKYLHRDLKYSLNTYSMLILATVEFKKKYIDAHFCVTLFIRNLLIDERLFYNSSRLRVARIKYFYTTTQNSNSQPIYLFFFFFLINITLVKYRRFCPNIFTSNFYFIFPH